MKLAMFCPCMRQYLYCPLASFSLAAIAILGIWLSPNPDGVQACEFWVSHCRSYCSKLGSLVDGPVHLQGLHNALVSRWDSTSHDGTGQGAHSYGQLAGVFSETLTETLSWVEVCVLNMWALTMHFSVTPSWGNMGKVRKYFLPLFMGILTQGLKKGTDLNLFLGFRNTFFLSLPYFCGCFT